MRRVVVLLMLLGLMSGVSLLKAQGAGPIDPITLAAIGFVVLASFSAAELGSRVGLPRVTGYILSGLLLGPSALDILSRPVVVEMGMFNTLALGLIATAAGLELDIGQIRSVGRTLLATVGAKVLLCMLTVGGAAWAMYAAFGLPGASAPEAGPALALTFGALAIGTSPAIVLAVLREGRAAGRLSDLVLGAAVLKDVVVVVVLAVALALAGALLGSGALDAGVLVDVGEELGVSVLAGALLGLLLIVYIRFVHTEMLLFISAMVLVVAEVGRVLHLEMLLVFIAAGFLVRNFSKHEQELHRPLEMVSLPVFVVFFTIAGASVDLAGTLAILPLALALFAARVLAFWGAARLGGRFGGEREVIVRRAFIAYLPQAGVTLGLVGLAAERLPALGETISSVGMAVVALNLLAGPVALKAALRAAGELRDSAKDAPEDTPEDPPEDPQTRDEGRAEAPRRPGLEAGPLPELAIRGLDDAGLRGAMEALARDLDALRREAIERDFVPWTLDLERDAHRALAEDTLRRWAETPHGDAVQGLGARSRALFDAARERLRALPAERTAPLGDEDLRRRPGDRLAVRWRRWRARLRRKLRLRLRPRRVPTRLSARTALEPELARLALDLVVLSARALGAVDEVLIRRARGELDAGGARAEVSEVLRRARTGLRADGPLRRGLERTRGMWLQAGGPELPVGEIRYSRARPVVRAHLRALQEQPERWRTGLAAGQRCLLLVLVLQTLRRESGEAIDAHVTGPALRSLRNASAVLAGLRAAVAETGRGVVGPPPPAQVPGLPPAARLAERMTRRDQPALEALLHGLRAAASIHAVAVGLRRSLRDLPASCAALRATTPISEASDPAGLRMREVDFQAVATETLLHGLLPRLDALLEATARTLALTALRAREAVDVALYALEAWQERGGEARAEGVAEAFERVDRRIGRLDDELRAAADIMQTDAERAATEAFEQLQAVAMGTEEGLARAGGGGALAARLRSSAAALRAPLSRATRRVGAAWRGLTRRAIDSRLGHRLRARTAPPPSDAIEMRAQARSWSRVEGLPEPYRRLFEPRPVRERRLFTARRDTLARLLAAEREWSGGGTGCPILLLGERGSGRTSLLNMCELELKVARLLRLEPAESARSAGLQTALALELRCPPRQDALLRTLRATRAAVLVDDLERWLRPDEPDLGGLEGFLDLVRLTRGTALWIVTTTPATARLLDLAAPLKATFPRIIELGPVDHETLRAAIEARHLLSGRDLVFPTSPLSRVAARLTGNDQAALFFRLVTRHAAGNLTGGMVSWLRAVEIGRDDVVRPSLPRALPPRLPPLAGLEAVQITLLLCALRFGGVSPRGLRLLLGLPAPELSAHASFLLAAGLLEPCGPPRDELQVPRALVAPLVEGLRELGVEP